MRAANQKIEDLLALWHQKRRSRAMPARDDLPVSVLRPWLGNLALIDVSGSSPYFRLCGNSLYTRFGGEMTRRKLDAIEGAHGKQALEDRIEEVRRTLSPKRTTHIATSPAGTTTFLELYVPLANDGVTIDTVLFASYVAPSSA